MEMLKEWVLGMRFVKEAIDRSAKTAKIEAFQKEIVDIEEKSRRESKRYRSFSSRYCR
jgi:hypothetical protein